MYGIGMIGVGVMGRRMAGAVASHPAFRMVAAFDPHPPSEPSGIAMKESPAAVITDPAVDCVYIASPPASHADLVAAATRHGKAIFCEKPLAASVAEARACVAAVRSAAIPAAVNFPFATAVSAVRLGELVGGGKLGQVGSATLTLRFARWPRGWQACRVAWRTPIRLQHAEIQQHGRLALDRRY
jgi:predicted dehydrogenase